MTISKLTERSAVLDAVIECDELGREAFLAKHGYREARQYWLVVDGHRYDSKAIVGVAYGYQFPNEGPLASSEFSGGEHTVRRVLERLGFEIVGPEEGAPSEVQLRKALFETLKEAHPEGEVPPAFLREHGIYGGAQGIWVDKIRTGPLSADQNGIAVGVLHTGKSYADELTDDGVIYHFPNTDRPKSRDQSEVAALANAMHLNVPVFVISKGRTQKFRTVRIGWVTDVDKQAETFLIEFSEPSKTASKEPETFRLKASREEKQVSQTVRVRSARFRFKVMQRYGAKCAFCGITEEKLLEAAHIRSVSEDGSDDPQNGLTLCCNHHKALDEGLILIEPTDLKLQPGDGIDTLDELGVLVGDLSNLSLKPHIEAVNWLWSRKRS